LQCEARKVTAFCVEKSKLRWTEGLNVAIPIENSEGIAILKHSRAIVRQRG
jgi:hypothetical protein